MNLLKPLFSGALIGFFIQSMSFAAPLPPKPNTWFQGEVNQLNCQLLEQQWRSYWAQLNRLHTQCLDAHSGRKNEGNEGGTCSRAECQQYHDPESQDKGAKQAIDRCYGSVSDRARLIREQEQLNRRVDGQQRALAEEQFNAEMARGNAERDAYNRAAEERNRQAAQQFQNQQQAAQRQAQIQAQAQAENQRRADAAAQEDRQRRNAIAEKSASEYQQAAAESEQETVQIKAKFAQEVASLSQENEDFDALIAAKKAKKARQAEAERAAQQAAEAERAKQQVASAEADRYGDCPLADAEIKSRTGEMNDFLSNSQHYGALAAMQVVMWGTNLKIEAIAAYCPDRKKELAQLRDAYNTAKENCEKLKSGGGKCVGKNPDSFAEEREDYLAKQRATKQREADRSNTSSGASNSSSGSSGSSSGSSSSQTGNSSSRDDGRVGVGTAR